MHIKKDGNNNAWKAKNRCKNCGRSFVDRRWRKQEVLFRTSTHFEGYICEGYSVRQLANQKKTLEHRVRRDIQSRLDASRITCISEVFPNVSHIMIDGYWLPKMKWHDEDDKIYTKRQVLLLYYDYLHEKVIWFSIRDWEKKEYIVEDLKFLHDHMGYTGIVSCTCDGWVSILAALRAVYPNCIIQRCLVHIERHVRSCISKNPKSSAWKELSRIMCYSILSDVKVFPKAWEDWKEKYREYINEKMRKLNGGWRYSHERLRKAIRHIENALPYMFQWHDHNILEIASTSNKIEWYFWVFAEEWIKEHKWLSPNRLLKFTALWIYLRNQK